MQLEKWFCVHILTQARNIKDTFPLEMFDISHSILLEQEGEGRQRIESGCVYMCVGAASASVDLNARKVLKSVHPRVGMCVCVCGTTARSETRRFCCPPLWVNLGHTLESGNFSLSNSGSNTCFVIIITSSAPCRILMESKCIVLELFAFVFVWACVCICVCVGGETSISSIMPSLALGCGSEEVLCNWKCPKNKWRPLTSAPPPPLSVAIHRVFCCDFTVWVTGWFKLQYTCLVFRPLFELHNPF